MEDFNNIINWDNLLKNSTNFQKNKPFKFGYVEEFLVREFYEKLYETFPKIDDTWTFANLLSKVQYAKLWQNLDDIKDKSLSKEWIKFIQYTFTNEFVSNFREYSGVNVTDTHNLGFLAYKKGGFQLPHIHNVGPNTLIIMLYFSKGWKKGDPGGTYMASDIDESKIIFEPYNLDNTMAIFHDGPKAAHGMRYITKDVVRQGFQITLDNFSVPRHDEKKMGLRI